MSTTLYARVLTFWRSKSIFHKLELIALVLLWLAIIVSAINFDYLPIVEVNGQYYAKAHGRISFEQARPYLIIEYAFWVTAVLYVAARATRWWKIRVARNARADTHDA
jgi:hypothetical protein